MADAVAWVTVGGFTLLFFFWAYGILAFVRDVRRHLPKAAAWVRTRRAGDGPDGEPDDGADDEQYLY